MQTLAVSCDGKYVIGVFSGFLRLARGIAFIDTKTDELAVLRQRLFEFLFDAEGIGGGARPEFPQRMPIALAPEEKSLGVFPALAEEGDDAVGELAEGHRVEGRGVEPVDDERAVAADPFEAFARRAFRGGLGGMRGERRLVDFFADEGIAEVLRPTLCGWLALPRIWRASGRACPPSGRICRGPCGRSAGCRPRPS
jgi:hypothetical protein